MSAPLPPRSTGPLSPNSRAPPPQRPEPTALQSPQEDLDNSNATLRPDIAPTQPAAKKKKRRNNHRGGKKRARRQSFATSTEDGNGMAPTSSAQRVAQLQSDPRSSFYRGRNLSNTSIESEALLDHRDHQSMRPRRPSTMGQSSYHQSVYDSPSFSRPTYNNPFRSSETVSRRPNTGRSKNNSGDEGFDVQTDERTPLIPSSARSKTSTVPQHDKRSRRDSSDSSKSRNDKKKTIFDKMPSGLGGQNEEYNVNYPPSVPGSPQLGAINRDMSFGDMMVRDQSPGRGSIHSRRSMRSMRSLREAACEDDSVPGSPRRDSGYEGRRHTIALQAEEDVCFPVDMSEMAEEDAPQREDGGYRRSRRHKSRFPDLSLLDDWSRFEKEGRSEERRAKKITEPQLIGGRLRPIHKGWHRAEDDAPYRFTYFNEEFQSTIHSQTISELVQPGGSFRELFIPDPPELEDSSESEDDEDWDPRHENVHARQAPGNNGDSRSETRQSSIIDHNGRAEAKRTASLRESNGEFHSRDHSRDATPNGASKSPPRKPSPSKEEKPKRYGERPTWWLDVLSPTDAEMKVISKTFGIHPLTAEDIMMQEAREKVELFRHYYFVNYRSFEQDMNNEDFLEPVNMYVVVFREGVISFHFSLTPHPANVRRRIRQLKDYLILSADWISYAIIDDITDVFAPLIQTIEDEVDDIDDAILRLHSPDDSQKNSKDSDKRSEAGDLTSGESGGDMLRRVGDCRKKVMGLYRLLGNKADVIKGFAKRCNEHWEIAPRSEIGLYLGDIQDHIVTMTGNLSHYEKILARSHGNYLAQINIRMNERQEQTADVLGKLTVLGTIVLPMNIITGLWGMNVWVPGQEYEGDLTWFWCITAGLLAFGLACFYIAKTAYKIV
ncbi:family metal ion transporter protein [Rutstroemia sp. NJR-2017a BBW]|nr:family metal ion transporter protein [Rutstroemia sp. NJR-2017a BBW]